MSQPVIRPAQLLSVESHLAPGKLEVTEFSFEVPLDYADKDAGSLRLFARAAVGYVKPIKPSEDEGSKASAKPWIAYLQGGPGFGNFPPEDFGLTKILTDRGYQVLYLDYRGTGLSTPVHAESLAERGDPQAQADYLKLFRADNIVRDFEAVRMCLTKTKPADKPADPKSPKWSILGQSYGGFVALTYLSFYPDSVREAFIAAGLPPLGRSPLDLYRATMNRVKDRNRAFFEKYPQDAARLDKIKAYLASQPDSAVALPHGGRLTYERLLGTGQIFGCHGGLDSVHNLLLRMSLDLQAFGRFTRATLASLEGFCGFDVAPLYAVLHEQIYCDGEGVASNWAASRAAAEAAPRDEGHFFAGEMIFPHMFDDYAELQPLKETAEILARFDGWEDLYDAARLARNEVPVYAVLFADDMYVDFDIARDTARKVGAIKVHETNGLYHNAIRSKTEEVMRQLFLLRDDVID